MLPTTVSLFGKFILRDLRRNWMRTALTVCGIALGVAVLLSISLANHTALEKFKETVDRVSGRSNLEIHSLSSSRMDEKVLYDLRWLWANGVKFSPLIDENAIVGDRDDGPLIEFIGMDMLADPDFKSYDEAGTGTDIDLLAPDTALVGARLAQDQHLGVGSTFKLLLNERFYTLKVGKILSSKGLGGAFSGNMVVTDIGTAQKALGSAGKISRVELIVPESQFSAVQAKLRAGLPSGLSVERPSQRGVQVEKMTRSFECNLLALTFIALMVGMFLIYNTMTITVIRRRPEIGTLRALGVSSGQILSMFTLEALTFGVVGTTLGIIAGILFAQGTLNAVSQTFEHFYFKEPIETVIVNPIVLAVAFFIGVTLTVVAAVPPSVEAANVAPAEATRRSSYELKASRNALVVAVGGLVVLALAAVAAMQPAVNNLPVFGYASALFTICGAAMLIPQLLKWCLPLFGAITGWLFRSEGKIAARSLYGTLGRTSVAVASLMIGIAMMVSLAIMIGSFRQTVMVWVDQSLKADLWIETAARGGGNRDARMAPETIDKIKSVPGVVAVDSFVQHPIEYDGERTNLAAGDFDVVGKYGHILFTDGENAKELCLDMHDGDATVSEAFAIRKHVKKGDVIEIPSPAGNVALHVRGVYYDYSSDLGFIVIPRSMYARLYGDRTLSSCAVYLAPAADPDKVRDEIVRAVGNQSNLHIRTTRELRREAIKIFDRTFAITYALHTIAICVALLSVLNALLALTMESKRDFGVLRYIGASERQLRRIVLVEAGLLGAIGNTAGLALGFVLSLLLIYVINKQSFGWTVQFTLPVEFLVESGLLVFITAILSGVLPARLAARTLAPSVVRDE
jgi:putative ABC transport system permease protein